MTHATTTTSLEPAAALMPDPSETSAVAAVEPGRADDLIASLADQQIDDLLSDNSTADPEADAAIDAALDAASQVDAAANEVLSSAAGELNAELAELEAERSALSAAAPIEAQTAKPVATVHTPYGAPDVPASGGAGAAAAVEAGPAVAAPAASTSDAAVEATPEPTLEATPETAAAPSFNPPPRAATEASARPKVVDPIAAMTGQAAEHSTSAEVAEAPIAPVPESSADAVAKELAEDAALLSKPLPSVVEHAEHEAKQPTWWGRAIDLVVSIPATVLGAINLPVQPLSDRAREFIGAAGIVTLVNATGLIVYLTLFAHRH